MAHTHQMSNSTHEDGCWGDEPVLRSTAVACRGAGQLSTSLAEIIGCDLTLDRERTMTLMLQIIR